MPFEKGRSGNPLGRPPIVNPAVRKAAEENKNALKACINKYLKLKPEEIKALALDPDLSTLEHLIAQSLSDAISQKYLPKYVLEAAMGPLVEDPTALTPDEKAFLARYRELRDASAQKALPSTDASDGSDPK